MAIAPLSDSLSFDAHNVKRISYISITKNRGDRLATVLSWVRGIMTAQDELIVIDGGSTDHTAEVVKGLNDGVDIFVSEPDISTGHALNKGILLARGKYIKQITDDDNSPLHEGMEKMYEVMEAHPEIDVLVGGGICRGENNKPIPFWLPPGTHYGSKPEDVFLYGACGEGIFIRRSIFAKIGLFSARSFVNDFEFLIRCFAKGMNVKFCRTHAFSHTTYDWSITTQSKHKANAEKIMLARQYCSKKFFISFYLKKSPLTRRPFVFIRRLSRALVGRRQKKEKVAVVWDGGFS